MKTLKEKLIAALTATLLEEIDAAIADRDVKPENVEEPPPFEPGSILETIAGWREEVKHPRHKSETNTELRRDRMVLELLDVLEALTEEARMTGIGMAHLAATDDEIKAHLERAAVGAAVETMFKKLRDNVIESRATVAETIRNQQKTIASLEKERCANTRAITELERAKNAPTEMSPIRSAIAALQDLIVGCERDNRKLRADVEELKGEIAKVRS